MIFVFEVILLSKVDGHTLWRAVWARKERGGLNWLTEKGRNIYT